MPKTHTYKAYETEQVNFKDAFFDILPFTRKLIKKDAEILERRRQLDEDDADGLMEIMAEQLNLRTTPAGGNKDKETGLGDLLLKEYKDNDGDFPTLATFADTVLDINPFGV